MTSSTLHNPLELFKEGMNKGILIHGGIGSQFKIPPNDISALIIA